MAKHSLILPIPCPIEVLAINMTCDTDFGSKEELLLQMITPDQMDRLAQGFPLKWPVRVEIHPYRRGQERPCSNDCTWCTKSDERARLAEGKVMGIDPERLFSLITSLDAREVDHIVLSGNSTEPLLYPEIKELVCTIKEAGFGLSLFSNFYYGKRILTDEVVSTFRPGDVIRVSLDAGSPKAYDKCHRPLVPETTFSTVLSNIALLANMRKEMRGEVADSFAIEIAFLLANQNNSREEINWLLDWASECGVNRVRFSVPLRPQIGNEAFDDSQLLNEEEATEIFRHLADKRSELESRGQRATEIQLLRDPAGQPRKCFNSCHHWKLIAVLGASGMFFPCTSTSLVDLRNALGGGDINSPDFEFRQFWPNAEKWTQITPGSCAGGLPCECTRFEFAVNRQIEESISMLASR